MAPGRDPVNGVTRPGPRNMDGSTRTITVAVPAPVPFQVTANGVVVYQGSTLLSKAASVPVPVTAGGQPVQSVSVTVNPAGAIQERSAQNNTMANINVAQTDQQVPVVVLSGPTLQDRVAEAWQWTAAITEDVRLDRVDWFLDGSLLVRNRTITSPGSQSLSLPVYVAGLSEGAHTLQVTAYDQAGHVGTSALASFTVRHPDLTPPRVSLGAVTDLNGFFTVSATAVDDRDGVDHVDFYMDKVKVATAAAAPYTVQIPNTASVIFGSHFMHAVAYDKAGLEPGGVANRAESPAVLFEKSTVLVEQEPNDDMVHANPLYDYSDGIQGSASLNGDSDWFKVPCTPGTSLTINGGMHTSIYDAAGVLRADSLLGADDGSTLPAAFISWKNTSATPYVYVSVKGRNILRRNPVTIDDPTPTYTLTYAGGPYRLTLRKQ